MATQNVEPTKSMVQTDATTNANYSAFDNAGMTPTMLGEIGSTVAQSASNALSAKWGYQAGMNPHGDIIPPITKADQVYQQAYLAQSNNTLSLQINGMMMQANEQLNSAYQITPGMISEYTKQMAEGTKQILENAPTTVKASLGYQYASQIQSTTHSLNNKLATQNKQKSLDHMNMVDKQTDTAIINKAMSGDVDGAKKLYQDKIERNKQQRNAGMMSETQAFTSNESAKVSLFTAQSNARAIEARKAGGKVLDHYLSSLANLDNKPSELSYDQYNTMGNNTLRFMNHLDSLEQNERNDIITDLNSKLFAGTLNDQTIEEARKSGILKPSDINTLTAKWNKWQASKAGSQNQLLGAVTGFNDTVAYGEASAKKQNEAFNVLTDSIKKKNPGSIPGQIEAEVASVAGGPNGSFFKQLTGLSRSAIPAEMAQASRMYHIVNGRSPENLSGLPQDTLDNIRAFDAFKELYPGDENTAAAKARNVMMPKTQDQKDANNAAWAEYRNKNLPTSSDRLTYAKNTLSANGLFFRPDVLSATETSTHISKILERYMKLFNGDSEAAKNATQDAVSTIYGETHANGANEVSRLPIEKFTGFGRKSTYFIQHDAINSLQSQFGAFRKAYDEGRSEFFYRVKNADTWSLSGLESTINQSKELKQQMDAVDIKMQKLNDKRNNAGYFENMKYDSEFESLNKQRNELGAKIKPIQEQIAKVNNWDKGVDIEQVWRGTKESETRPNVKILSEGNIDLYNRIPYKRPDGKVETVFSTSVNFDGKEVLIPQIDMKGNKLTTDEAIAEYKNTGKHLGIFENSADATKYAKWLHRQQESLYANNDGRVDTYTLSMNAGENASFSYDTNQPVLGDYDIFLVNPKGARVSIQALAGHSMLPVVYTPDFKSIRTNTAGFINATGGQASYEEAMKKYKQSLVKKPEPKKGISNTVLASRGMTAELARRQFLGGSDDE